MWDWVLLAATLALTPAVLRILFDPKAYVPRSTSGVFAVAIGAIALSLYHLDAPLGAIANAFGTLEWIAVFALRGSPAKPTVTASLESLSPTVPPWRRVWWDCPACMETASELWEDGVLTRPHHCWAAEKRGGTASG